MRYYIDGEAVQEAAEQANCSSAEALRRKFGGGHSSWVSALTGGPVSDTVLRRVCQSLDLDPEAVKVDLLSTKVGFDGFYLTLPEPTVLDFRGEYDPRPDAKVQGSVAGRCAKTVRSDENRLFILFSSLQLHRTDQDKEIFVKKVSVKVTLGDVVQSFIPFEWCKISKDLDSLSNPEVYWLATLKGGPEWTNSLFQQGFTMGQSVPKTICEECSFVALPKGDLNRFVDLLDFVDSGRKDIECFCTILVEFRQGSEEVIKRLTARFEFPFMHLRQSKHYWEEKHGYAPTLQALVNLEST